MWCLETIIQVNEVASELEKQDRPTREAYALCGINCSNMKLIEEFEREKKMRVVA